MSRKADFQDWAAIKPLVIEALAVPASERHQLLASMRADPVTRARVEHFVRAYERGEGVLEPDRIDSMDPLIGTRIGRYSIVRLLGYGGMGAVYQALQDQPHRTVALKLMRAGLVSPGSLRRFELESQVLARLHHPNIAQVFEAGTHQTGLAGPWNATPYYAMEYVPGGQPITTFCESRVLSIDQRLQLFISICDAVHHGHVNGVIHRDLKPANILVDANGQPKIIDFGIARMIGAEGSLATMATGSGQLLGTLQYMSPEHCGGDSSTRALAPPIDTRSDIYSLGVVLYELLTGRLPYDVREAPLPEAVRIICESSPPTVSSIVRSLRGALSAIVGKAMEKQVERRYQSALEMGEDIRRYLRHEPISAHPPSATYQLRVFARRNKGLVAGVAASFVILVAGIVAVSAALTRSVRMEQQAIEERDRARKTAAFLKTTLLSGNPVLGGASGVPFDQYQDPFADLYAEYAWVGPREGRTYSVTELLEHAAALLEVSFEDEPQIKAEIADTLGVSMAPLSLPQGLPLIRQALEIRRRELGEDHIETINSKLHLGAMLVLGEADSIVRSAIDSLTRTRGADDARTLAASMLLANVLAQGDRREEALSIARNNIEVAERAFGSDHPVTLAHIRNLSMYLPADSEEGLALSRRAMEGLRAAYGEDSIPVADALSSHSGRLCLRGEFAEAERFIRSALAIYARHYGAGSIRKLGEERGLFEVLRRQGKHAEAVAVVRENLDRCQGAFQPNHHQILRLEDRLARALLGEGVQIDEAEELSRRAANGALATFPREDVLTILYRNTHAEALRRKGRAAEAESIIRELIALAPDESMIVLALNQNLGECLIDQRRFDEAEQALRLAERHGAVVRTDDPYEPRVINLWRSWVRLYESQGKPIDAEPYRIHLAGVKFAPSR